VKSTGDFKRNVEGFSKPINATPELKSVSQTFSMRRPIPVKQFFALSMIFPFFPLSQAAYVATLPSTPLGERFSPGASRSLGVGIAAQAMPLRCFGKPGFFVIFPTSRWT